MKKEIKPLNEKIWNLEGKHYTWKDYLEVEDVKTANQNLKEELNNWEDKNNNGVFTNKITGDSISSGWFIKNIVNKAFEKHYGDIK